jgi:hypothetical protein
MSSVTAPKKNELELEFDEVWAIDTLKELEKKQRIQKLAHGLQNSSKCAFSSCMQLEIVPVYSIFLNTMIQETRRKKVLCGSTATFKVLRETNTVLRY